MADPSPRLQNLYAVVQKIPPGQVASYGAVGRALERPVSGLLAGRWMATCPPEIPWWRVVGADGSLKTAKRGPHIADDQKTRLQEEGVIFDDQNRVQKQYFLPPDTLLNS